MIKKTVMLILCMITMLSITLLSSQNAEKSTKLSVGISEKIVDAAPKTDKLLENERDISITNMNIKIRNIAHFTLFLIFGVVIYITMQTFGIRHSFVLSLSICILYALFDETYQMLLQNGRTFEMRDLVKDWIGTLVGITIIQTLLFVAKKWKCS